MKRVFDTDALAAAFPFTSPDLPVTAGDTGMGVLYGLNLHSPGCRGLGPVGAVELQLRHPRPLR